MRDELAGMLQGNGKFSMVTLLVIMSFYCITISVAYILPVGSACLCLQVQLFQALASLYRDMRMFRKSAFYSRIAAMQFVSPANRQPSWHQCYNLLMRALPGYQVSLDPKEMLSGWFWLQSCVSIFHSWLLSVLYMEILSGFDAIISSDE